MNRLYEKNEVGFALVWIGLYVVVMNIALQMSGGLDDLAEKTAGQLLVPVVCILVLAAACTGWILRRGLAEQMGLCRVRRKGRDFLWFLPLAVMSCTNLVNGLALQAPAGISLLMMVNMAAAGYVEEVIFRGVLFRGMAKNGLKSAVIVSAVTFGAGHIVNLANTADTLGVLLQVCYAVTVGFLYTVIAWRGGSLVPCIISHMFVNGSSVFAAEQGPFSRLVAAVSGNTDPALVQTCSAAVIMVISGGYGLWLWKRRE